MRDDRSYEDELEDQLHVARSVTSSRTLLAAMERGFIVRVQSIDELQRTAAIRITDDDLHDQLNAARAETSARTLRLAREMGIIATPNRTEGTDKVRAQSPSSTLAAK
jgi:hypothetical protein